MPRVSGPRRRLLLLPALLGICGALLAACGGGSETATIGTSEVTISGEPDALGDKVRAILEKEPYEKWALNCIVGQFEKVLTPAEEEKLEGGSEEEFGEFLIAHGTELNQACEQPGRHVFDPHASEAELAVVRSGEVAALRSVFKAAGVDEGEARCIERIVAHLPGPQLVPLIEAPEDQRGVMFEELARSCGAG